MDPMSFYGGQLQGQAMNPQTAWEAQRLAMIQAYMQPQIDWENERRRKIQEWYQPQIDFENRRKQVAMDWYRSIGARA